jgi:hypothetical protein
MEASDARDSSRDSDNCVSADYSNDRCHDLGLPSLPTFYQRFILSAFLLPKDARFGYLYHFLHGLYCCIPSNVLFDGVQRQNLHIVVFVRSRFNTGRFFFRNISCGTLYVHSCIQVLNFLLIA